MTLSDLARLSPGELAAAIAGQRLPPVTAWNPERCGHSGMRIAADGGWHHHGRPIGRPELIRLFASLLRREADGRHVLVTPVEKLDIDVEDAALVVVGMRSDGIGRERMLTFALNSEELVVAGAAHRIRIEQRHDGPRPYLDVRDGLEARIGRATYYELAEMALAEGSDPPGLWSDGVYLPLVPA